MVAKSTITRNFSREHTPAAYLRRAPSHPGEILREDMLPALHISQASLARILQLSRQHLNRILNCDNPVTAETAVKLSRLFNNSAQFWLNLQNNYDVWEARQKLRTQLGEIAEARARMISTLYLKEDEGSKSGDAFGSLIKGGKRDLFEKLTVRQREILQLLAKGNTMSETAQILGVTPRTVTFHKYRIMETLGFKDISQLVRSAINRGLRESD